MKMTRENDPYMYINVCYANMYSIVQYMYYQDGIKWVSNEDACLVTHWMIQYIYIYMIMDGSF